MNDINKALGRRVWNLRLNAHISRETLAEKVNLSVKFIYEVETGQKGISVESLLRLAGFFSVTPNFLLGLENTPALNLEGLTPQQVSLVSALVRELQRSNRCSGGKG